MARRDERVDVVQGHILDLAGARIPALRAEQARIDQAVDHEKVGRGAEVDRAGRRPQGLALVQRKGGDLPPVRAEHHAGARIHHERRRIVSAGSAAGFGPSLPSRGRLGCLGGGLPVVPPDLSAGLQVHADDGLARLVADALSGGGQCHRLEVGGFGPGLLPRDGAGLGVDCPDGLAAGAGGFPAAFGGRVGAALAGMDNHHQQQTVVDENLVRAGRACVRLDDLARSRVQRRDRCVQAQRYVHTAARGHQAPRKLRRPGPECPHVVGPRGNGLGPEELAVERVPRHQPPLRRKVQQRRRALVDDAEQPPAGRHHRAEAGELVVMAAEYGPGSPLDASRRAGDGVIGHGVAVGGVHVVRPVVDLVRAGLDGLPAVYVRHPVGAQHAHYLGGGNFAAVLDYHEVHRVRDIWQVLAAPQFNGGLARELLRTEMLARGGDVARDAVQAVHEQRVACRQGGSQLPVPAAHVNDQPAGDARGLQDVSGAGATCGPAERRKQHHRGKHDTRKRTQSVSLHFHHPSRPWRDVGLQYNPSAARRRAAASCRPLKPAGRRRPAISGAGVLARLAEALRALGVHRRRRIAIGRWDSVSKQGRQTASGPGKSRTNRKESPGPAVYT